MVGRCAPALILLWAAMTGCGTGDAASSSVAVPQPLVGQQSGSNEDEHSAAPGDAESTAPFAGTDDDSGESPEADTNPPPTTTTEPTTTTTEPTTTTTEPTTTVPARSPTPDIVRGLRISARGVAPDRFAELLAQADTSVVNTFVFDTKTEAGDVLYDTGVEFALAIGAVNDLYDPTTLVTEAKAHGLYTVTRIVTFEDDHWAAARPAASLGGTWIDAADEANWEYPIALAVEACRLGFDEVQFDYVRFPDGSVARRARGIVPSTMDERTAVIAGFLAEARSALADEGCKTSAAVFGIITASITDEGIGQTVDALSPNVDTLSPMLYPSHYSPGWLGFADPNDHPAEVVAHALDSAADDMAPGTAMRPWIQAFYYNGAQIRAEIEQAEKRGAGWILWNASGTYGDSWLPTE